MRGWVSGSVYVCVCVRRGVSIHPSDVFILFLYDGPTHTHPPLQTRPLNNDVTTRHLPSIHPTQAFTYFDCRAGGPRAWTYSLAALNHGMRALAVAKETYVRINDAGE